MRNEALKLWNTTYVYMWCKETFLLGDFKTKKKLVQFKTINHFSAQDWEKVEREKNYLCKRAGA